MTFSEKLIRLRKREGLSQEGLAEILGVSRQAVSRWEQGTTLPDGGKLLPCARHFSVTVDWLLDEEQDWEAQRGESVSKGMNIHQQGIIRTVSGVVLSTGMVVLLTILIEGMSLNIRVSEDGRNYTGIAAFVRYYHVEWLVAVGAALVLLGAAGLIWLKLWRWWHQTP